MYTYKYVAYLLNSITRFLFILEPYSCSYWSRQAVKPLPEPTPLQENEFLRFNLTKRQDLKELVNMF